MSTTGNNGYNPPSLDNWHQVGDFVETYVEYYDKGFNDASNNKQYQEPFEWSKHERDSSHTDELNYWYYKGYYDYK